MNRDLTKLIDRFTESHPDLWKICYPKFYQDTERYLSAKEPARNFFMIALDVLGITPTNPSLTEIAVFSTLLKLHQYKMPLFYVGKDLFEAVLRSEPPEQERWDTLELPFNAAVFMLPRKSLIHPVNGEVSYLAYSRIHNGERFALKQHDYEATAASESFTVVYSAHEDLCPPSFHVTLTADVDPWISRASIDVALEYENEDLSGLNIPFVKGEKEFSSLATSIVFRLLLAMEARPALVERGKFTGKKIKSGAEVWTPNFIGKNYRYQRTGEAHGDGWTVRMHWRRGHFRQQPYGHRSSLRRRIWLEPVLVGADEHSRVESTQTP